MSRHVAHMGLVREEGGDWEWVNGDPVDYTNWKSKAEGERDVGQLEYAGTWSAGYKDGVKPYICQYSMYCSFSVFRYVFCSAEIYSFV